MNEAAAFRGQPLIMLGGLVSAWAVLRVLSWQPLFQVMPSALPVAEIAQPAVATFEPIRKPDPVASKSALAQSAEPRAAPVPRTDILPPMWATAPVPLFQPAPAESPAVIHPVRSAVAHNLMLFAGLSVIELPPAIVAYLQSPPTVPVGGPRAAPGLPVTASTPATVARWSGDSWLLLRGDRGAPLAAGQPTYGRSQGGAVLRYRLAPGSSLRPEAYLRGAVALTGPREREVAVGLSARALARVPIRLAAEARVSDTALGTEVRPAAFAVTELAPVALPLGARAEVYVQGGYVGGRFATAFVDGQARVQHTLVGQGETSVSAGGGVWGGAQRGAARVDVGPTADIQFRLGDTRGRVAADYRFRVAGDAAPASGPALTLSAGF